jgi:bacillithiol biosynthesis deacetylase BshB1
LYPAVRTAGFFLKSTMKLDILAFGAHPDDVELGAGGILAKHAALGYKTGIIDLTLGEMGTRGTPELRQREAKKAAAILNCAVRENLEMRDGFLQNDEKSQLLVIQAIRKFKPDIVLCTAPTDRHPDHGAAAKLVVDAAFKSGLHKLETTYSDQQQAPWRPRALYHYIQFHALQPDFIVDISGFGDQKMNAIKAHGSQFYDPHSNEPETVIASKYFFESIESRAREYGRQIYAELGEGLLTNNVIGVNDLFKIK